MELASRKTIQYLCEKYKCWPSRSSGQNFLINARPLNTMIDAADIHPGDMVLEIGAGFGTLTQPLADAGASVLAVEQDCRLCRAVRKLAKANPRIIPVCDDIKTAWRGLSGQLTDQKYKLVANLPYNITSLVLRQFTEQSPRPERLVVMVQREVAERVVAEPGQMSLLSVAVQFYAQPEIVSQVPREYFWPQPRVDSAVLASTNIGQDVYGYQAQLGEVSDKSFFRVVKIGFSGKRKQLHNNIAAGLRLSSKQAQQIIAESGIDPAARPQELSIQDWVNLAMKITHVS